MKKILFAALMLASFGYAVTADASPGRNDEERKAWFDTMHSVRAAELTQQNAPVVEGRNSATAPTPYGTVRAPGKPHHSTY